MPSESSPLFPILLFIFYIIGIFTPVVLHNTQTTVISLSQKHETYWNKNKEELIGRIATGIITGFIGSLFTWFLMKK